MNPSSGTTPNIHITRDLAENEATRVSQSSAAAIVHVHRGTVLVTRKGDLQECVLLPGEELRLCSGRLGVARALTDATISVRAA